MCFLKRLESWVAAFITKTNDHLGFSCKRCHVRTLICSYNLYLLIAFVNAVCKLKNRNRFLLIIRLLREMERPPWIAAAVGFSTGTKTPASPNVSESESD